MIQDQQYRHVLQLNEEGRSRLETHFERLSISMAQKLQLHGEHLVSLASVDVLHTDERFRQSSRVGLWRSLVSASLTRVRT